MEKTFLVFTLAIVGITLAYSYTNKSEINAQTNQEQNLAFDAYWYGGEAELSSYVLKQARYGEIREGHAVLIYVTEDFLKKEQVKADKYDKSNIPVLKLNYTKKFNTGIYPYSIMQSTFYPVSDDVHAIKVSASMQEWCGHAYSQLNNRSKFEVLSHSYFESEADKQFSLRKAHLENEVWTKIRINLSNLPTGKIEMIPSFEFCRLKHKDFKAYTATASLVQEEDLSVYTIEYPELNRSLKIEFQSFFPHIIESWSETFESGFGSNAKTLTTTASRIKTIKSKYWTKNGNKHEVLRDSLGIGRFQTSDHSK
jgi:hypothetical protein